MRRGLLLACGLLGAVVLGSGGPLAAGAEELRPSGSGARPPIVAPERSGLAGLLDGVVAEIEYSGGRALRIARGTRDGLADLLGHAVDLLPTRPVQRPAAQPLGPGTGAPAARAPEAAAPGAAAPETPAPAGGSGERRGLSDPELDATLLQLHALRTPPISDPGYRPVGRDAEGQEGRGRGALPPSAAAPTGQETAAGARQLLRRLEARGDFAPRWEEDPEAFVAALPPAALEARFDAWAQPASLVAPASQAEEAPPVAARCRAGEPGPSDLTAQLDEPGEALRLAILVPDQPRRLEDGSLFVPKPQQRLFGVRTLLPCLDTAPRVEQLPGRVIGNPNASGLVQAGQTGRVRPGPQGLLPELGASVRRGQPLAVLAPSLSILERGQLESELAELRAEIIGTELALARMRDFPVVPFRTGRMLSLRLELDGLRRQRDALIAGIDNHEVLLSPIDGVVSEARALAGQLVQTGDTLWTVVDPRHLRIEATAAEDLRTPGISGAWAQAPDESPIHLAFVGRGLAVRDEGVPLHFEIRSPPGGLSLGAPIAVYVGSGESEPGMVLPRAALVHDQAGRAFVWEHLDGERFIERPVRAEPLDGQWAIVRAGIAEDARVVYRGAEQLATLR